MSGFFQRQIASYAEYHRDGRNCWMHIIGNPILTLAAFLPFSLLPVTVFGVQINAATLLVMPALLFWISLDVAIGLGIVVVAIPLLFAAAAIVSHVSVAWVWIITAALIRHRLGHANHRAQMLRRQLAGARSTTRCIC